MDRFLQQGWYLFYVNCNQMSKLQLHRPWYEVKEMLKEINGSLTDEDLLYEEGKEDDLLEHLAGKINMTMDEVKGLIESVSYNEGKAS